MFNYYEHVFFLVDSTKVENVQLLLKMFNFC
jgi:hypothetical protein